jgi:hypothetical protein
MTLTVTAERTGNSQAMPKQLLLGPAVSHPWSISICGQQECAGLLKAGVTNELSDRLVVSQLLFSTGLDPTSSHLFLGI